MHKIKTKVAALAVAAAFGVTGLAFTAPAFATPDADETETCVPSDATTRTETSDWVTTVPDGDGWEEIDSRVVEDSAAVYKTEYQVGFYKQTDWLLGAPDERPWTQIAERKVIDVTAEPGAYEATGWLLGPPSDGRTWTQIAQRYVVDVAAVPAQGTPTIEVENPNYVPEQTINHAAEYRTEYQWKWWGYHQHGVTVWTDGSYPTTVPNDYPGEWQKNGKTRKVETKAAWTETIPAQGTPTITVENPNYVPAVAEQGHYEYKYAWHKAPVAEVSHQEYKYALHIAAYWTDTVPTGDGWKVKDERQTLVTEAVTHIEYLYEREIDVPAVTCPTDEPTETPTTEEPTVTPEPTVEPTSETPTAEEPTVTTKPTVEPTSETPTSVSARTVATDADDEQVNNLASTGVSTRMGGTIILAVGLILLGIYAVRRRRRTTQD